MGHKLKKKAWSIHLIAHLHQIETTVTTLVTSQYLVTICMPGTCEITPFPFIHAKDTIEEAPPLGPHRNRPAASPGNSPVHHGMFQQLHGIQAWKNPWKFKFWNYDEKSICFSVSHWRISYISSEGGWSPTKFWRILSLQPEKPPWLYHSDPSRRTPGRSWAFVPPAPFFPGRCRSSQECPKRNAASHLEKKTSMRLKN